MRNSRNLLWAATFVVVGMVVGAFLVDDGTSVVPTASAAGGGVESPVGVAPDRYVYYPGTEELDKDEIRIIAAGTGMPGARRGQAATCFLVELGDGQKQGDTLLALGISMFKSGRRQEGFATYQAGLSLLEKPTIMQRLYRLLLAIQVRLLGCWT